MCGPSRNSATGGTARRSGSYQAGGRQGAEQPTLIGPTAPRLTTSSLGWWAAASRQAPRCTPLIFVIALACGLGQCDWSPSRQRCGKTTTRVSRRPTACNQTASADTKRHQTPRSEALSQHHCWSFDGRTCFTRRGPG